MNPDTTFKFIKSHNGKNRDDKPVRFEEGKEYSRTTVDMKQTGHGLKGAAYFLHDWDTPSGSNVERSPEDFGSSAGEYCDQERILA